MQPSRFDDLTKALATSTSRRQVLKTITATTIGSILGLGSIGTAFAKCKPVGHKCNHDHQCCSGRCLNGTCVTPVSCIPEGQDCTEAPNDCCGTSVCSANGTCGIL